MSTNEVSWTSSAYPQYENYEQRLNTYFVRFWPISIRQNGMTMAKAGFFYRGFGDRMRKSISTQKFQNLMIIHNGKWPKPNKISV